MIRISLFFTFFITIVQSATAQLDSLQLFTGINQVLEYEFNSTPYKPQLMTLPQHGTASFVGGDDLLGVLGPNTLTYQPAADYVGSDQLKIGIWEWTNFGSQFIQRWIDIEIGDGTNVSGRIFFDENDNCNFEASERRLPNRKIRISNPTYERILTTNRTGDFSLLLPTGIYDVVYFDDNPVWRACPLMPLVVNENVATEQYDIPLQAVTDQPHLSVDITTARLRRLFGSPYN